VFWCGDNPVAASTTATYRPVLRISNYNTWQLIGMWWQWWLLLQVWPYYAQHGIPWINKTQENASSLFNHSLPQPQNKMRNNTSHTVDKKLCASQNVKIFQNSSQQVTVLILPTHITENNTSHYSCVTGTKNLSNGKYKNC